MKTKFNPKTLKCRYFIGAAIGAAGAAAGNIMQSINAGKQRDFEREENEKARQWNAAQADKSYERSIEQWNRENAYNTPAAQMKRMKEGGLNPDLMYGQGGAMNTAANSPDSPVPAAAEPTTSAGYQAMPNYGNILSSAAQYKQMDASSELMAANAEKARADADKSKAETSGQGYTNEILKSDSQFRSALNSGQIKLQNVSFSLSKSNIKLNNFMMDEIKKKMNVLDEQCKNFVAQRDELKSRIANQDADTVYKQIVASCYAPEMRARVNELASRSNLQRKEAASIISMLPLKLAGIQLDNAAVRLSNEGQKLTNTLLGIEGDQMTFNLEFDRNNKYNFMLNGAIQSWVTAGATAAGAFFLGKKGGAIGRPRPIPMNRKR